MKSYRYAFALFSAALLIGCNGQGDHLDLVSMGDTSIADGAIKIDGESVSLHPHGAPQATIDGAGDFSVDGTPVVVTPPQRALLLRYRAAAIGVRKDGIATGSAGVTQALSSVAGDSDTSDGDRTTQAAMKICDDLDQIRAAQDQLANQLAAFKPYAALISKGSVKDCRN